MTVAIAPGQVWVTTQPMQYDEDREVWYRFDEEPDGFGIHFYRVLAVVPLQGLSPRVVVREYRQDPDGRVTRRRSVRALKSLRTTLSRYRYFQVAA